MLFLRKILIGAGVSLFILGAGLKSTFLYANGEGGSSAPAATPSASEKKVSGAKALKDAANTAIDEKIKNYEERRDANLKEGNQKKADSFQTKTDLLRQARDEVNSAKSLKDISAKWDMAKYFLSKEQIDKANQVAREHTGKGIDGWTSELEKRLKDPKNKNRKPAEIEAELAEEIKAATQQIADEKRREEEQRKQALEGISGPSHTPAMEGRDLEH